MHCFILYTPTPYPQNYFYHWNNESIKTYFITIQMILYFYAQSLVMNNLHSLMLKKKISNKISEE